MLESPSITPAQWEANRWKFIEALAARLPLFMGKERNIVLRIGMDGSLTKFDSVRAAAKAIGVDKTAISNAIYRNGSCGGYR